MKKFLFFLSSKSFWIFLGVIGLIALIWLIGPLVAIGESKPLASFQTRTLLCLIIVMIWIGLIVFKHVREARRNAKLLQEIRAAQEPILKESSDVGSMSKQFSEITSVLKNAIIPRRRIKNKTNIFPNLKKNFKFYHRFHYNTLSFINKDIKEKSFRFGSF